MSIFSKCLEIDENNRKKLDIGLIWEGNFWDDQDVHDCCDVDWETCHILANKISIAFKEHVKEHEKIVLLLPKIIQLPLSIMAAINTGIIPIILDPLTISHQHLASQIQAFNPKLLVTVDAFWQAQKLIEVKKTVENLDETLQLLVIRHVAPNPGVPPPKKHFPAKRPSYRTMLDLRDGRDLEWSDVMSRIESDVKVESFQWKNEDIVAILVEENKQAQNIQYGQLEEALEKRANSIFGQKYVENTMVIDFPDKFEHFVDFLVPWYSGKTLTLYEGPLNYPDSSRLAQIIKKHHVDCLIATAHLSPSSLPNPEYLNFFDTSNLTHLISTSPLLLKHLLK